MTSSFENSSVVITGGGSGIGCAAAHRFATLGAQVRIGDVNEAGMEDTCRDHPGITAAHCDVSDEDSVATFVGDAVDDQGGLDIVVNLAGVLAFGNTHEVDFDDWKRIMDINVNGTFLMCRAALRVMLDPERGRTDGVIINTASTAAHIGQAWSAAYCASKGAVLSFTRALAVEYGRRGIRANSVSPGGIQTPIFSSFLFPEEADRSLLKRTMPLGDMGQPEDVAAAITYLAGDEAGYVNGADLRVDGATTA